MSRGYARGMILRALGLAALLAVPASAGERVTVRDAGGFDPAGRTVEFPDRFGWRGYEAEFTFSFAGDGTLASNSRLDVSISRRGESKWKYACRASSGDLTTRVVPLAGRVSVIAECRVKPKAFAKAVNLDAEDVGVPVFVFEAVIENGGARAGGQRGLRFRPDAPVASVDLSPYASFPDAAGLAVAFRAD